MAKPVKIKKDRRAYWRRYYKKKKDRAKKIAITRQWRIDNPEKYRDLWRRDAARKKLVKYAHQKALKDQKKASLKTGKYAWSFWQQFLRPLNRYRNEYPVRASHLIKALLAVELPDHVKPFLELLLTTNTNREELAKRFNKKYSYIRYYVNIFIYKRCKETINNFKSQDRFIKSLLLNFKRFGK